MKIIDLGKQNSIIGQYMAEVRDVEYQQNRLLFRNNITRIGEMMAYEISKTLNYEIRDVTTPLGIAKCSFYTDNIVLASILRAGLPLHDGLLSFFDSAQNAFVAAYRKYGKDNKFTIQFEYASSPSLEEKVLILADPMLATGSSLVLAYQRLIQMGEPVHTHIVSPIASEQSLGYLSKQLPHKRVTLWVAAVDEELTNKSYIVPGLGDAGDLAYGEKL